MRWERLTTGQYRLKCIHLHRGECKKREFEIEIAHHQCFCLSTVASLYIFLSRIEATQNTKQNTPQQTPTPAPLPPSPSLRTLQETAVHNLKIHLKQPPNKFLCTTSRRRCGRHSARHAPPFPQSLLLLLLLNKTRHLLPQVADHHRLLGQQLTC